MARRSVFYRLIDNGKAGGLFLIACTVFSLLLSNTGAGTGYIHFWHSALPFFSDHPPLPATIEAWINDGLMTVFFLLVGLEIERECYTGELASARQAILPVVAAIGGMVVPALIHILFNHGLATGRGFGIPMATDIAFSLGVLSLCGKNIPVSLKIFLTALAIIDDLGAVVVIALFYTSHLSWFHLGLAFGLSVLLGLLNRFRVRSLWVYLPAGVVLWFLFLRSGIHPTLSGIILAFLIPFRSRNGISSPSFRLEHRLTRPVAFIVVPLFALANTAIRLPANWLGGMMSSNSLGITTGLIIGKCAGITGFTLLAVWIGKWSLAEGINYRRLIGAGMLGGIGFTMSIFISNLAFPEKPELIDSSKIAVLLASLVSALIGGFILAKQGPGARSVLAGGAEDSPKAGS